MGARFPWDDVLPTHGGDIDNVYDARITDGDIEVARSLIEENDVWGAAKCHIGQHAA